MASQEDDDLNLPEIPHERTSHPGKPDSVLKAAHVERRGIRYHRQNEYYNPKLGLADRMMTGDDPAFIREWLIKRANAVLRKAGELDYFQVLDTVEDSKADVGVEGMDAGSVALHLNFANVIQRHGYLSRESNASRFLAMNDRVGSVIGSDIEKWEVMMEWADAWYWLRFEESAAHYLAFSGIKALAGRQSSAPKRSFQKQQQHAVIREEFIRLKLAGQKLDVVVADLMEPVNERFRHYGWKLYVTTTMRRAIASMKLVSNAKNTGKKVNARPSNN